MHRGIYWERDCDVCVLRCDPLICNLKMYTRERNSSEKEYEKNLGSQKEVYKKQLAIYEQITILIVKKKHMKPWTNALAYNNPWPKTITFATSIYVTQYLYSNSKERKRDNPPSTIKGHDNEFTLLWWVRLPPTWYLDTLFTM